MSVLDRLPAGITGIDTWMGGSSEITAGFLLAGERPALIETGPAKVAAAVAAGVAGAGLDPADLAWIVVTHIHLDHAGGVGDLVRTFPNATVVVHPAGARHLVDPERLLASSAGSIPASAIPAAIAPAALAGPVSISAGRSPASRNPAVISELPPIQVSIPVIPSGRASRTLMGSPQSRGRSTRPSRGLG